MQQYFLEYVIQHQYMVKKNMLLVFLCTKQKMVG